jgi:formate hydrogenlyase subunit 3/multisubunit Na+/H+ antiporter MnhD subunit
MELRSEVILLIPIIAGILGYLVGRKNEKFRNILLITFSIINFIIVVRIFPLVEAGDIVSYHQNLMGIGLYLRLDLMRYVFILLTSLVWMLVLIYSTTYIEKYSHRNRYYLIMMLTYGSTIGFFLCDNLLNLFAFFEMVSFTSYFLVIHDEDKYSHEAGVSYLSMAIFGGLLILLGIFLLSNYVDTLSIMTIDVSTIPYNIKIIIGLLFLIGFGVKASLFPFHGWLPKAHPAAPAPASAILSGVLIKTGVFGIYITLIEIMKGEPVLSITLMILAMINIIHGGTMAIFQRNMKRIIAYSSMSQAGFILLGISIYGISHMESLETLGAIVLYSFNHSMFKVLLFLVAGMIYLVTHDLSINKIRGFGRHKLFLKILFIIGFFGLCGIPGFNGYISKTLMHHQLHLVAHTMGEAVYYLLEFVFFAGSVLTAAYMIKIFRHVFMENNEEYMGQHKKEMRNACMLSVAIFAAIVVYTGLVEHQVMNILETITGEHHFHGLKVYDFKSILTSLGILTGGLLLSTFARKKLYSEENLIYTNPTLKWFSIEMDIMYRFFRIFVTSITNITIFLDKSINNTITSFNAKIRLLNSKEEENVKEAKGKCIPLIEYLSVLNFENVTIDFSVVAITVVVVIAFFTMSI